MSRKYSPKTFIQKTPNALLKQFFEQKNIAVSLDWDKLRESDVDLIYNAVQELDDAALTKVENAFRQINEMACPKGAQCLIEEGSVFHVLNLADTFEAMSNPYEMALWTYLNHHPVFYVAESLYRMDIVNSWKQCAVFRGLKPKIEKEQVDAFVDELIEFYKEQGRGRHCVIHY